MRILFLNQNNDEEAIVVLRAYSKSGLAYFLGYNCKVVLHTVNDKDAVECIRMLYCNGVLDLRSYRGSLTYIKKANTYTI